MTEFAGNMRRRTALLLGGMGGLIGAGLLWLGADRPLRADLIDEPRFREAVSSLVRQAHPERYVRLDPLVSGDTIAACLLWRDGANSVVPRALRPKDAAWSASWLATIPHSDEVIVVFLSPDGFQPVSFPTSYVFGFPEAGRECVRSQRLAIERRQGHLHLVSTAQDRVP
ncbi:hypothetical protein [Neoroseomonas soli]|uniref:Uncharacterized protein n=1 Tax=Neoroseomonas soli TaxID=1081025 RepID=A0A9X9X1V1_9PROT|nr:hypothetical protein [Neoroseomonas soli]MBR0673380.1 hypothetical protein [Neoroseomonas soli]